MSEVPVTCPKCNQQYFTEPHTCRPKYRRRPHVPDSYDVMTPAGLVRKSRDNNNL